MTTAEAEAFAQEWLAAWNAHDLERILSHYADDVKFLSPKAEALIGTALVSGKEALRAYWGAALASLPSLQFRLVSVFTGANALTVLYRNDRGEEVTETFLLNDGGKVDTSLACYRHVTQ